MVLVLPLAFFSGCGDDEKDDLKTVQGLQEENRSLREHVGRLESAMAEREEEHRKRLAAGQSELAEKALRLTALGQENQAMREILETDPKFREMLQTNYAYERLVYFLLILILAGAAVWGWRRYRDALGRLNQALLQRSARFAASEEWYL
jgi:predicted RNase H-like nuclease (RuvC/YqgF family)